MVWCWTYGGKFFLSNERPPIPDGDDSFWQIGPLKSSILFPIATAVAWIPAGMEHFLPASGEVRHMKFHEELWGAAKDLPSYNKRLWTDLQTKLKQ